jgi:hypothetical protein
MNSNVIYIIDDVHGLQLELEELEKENNNMYRIVGIIAGHYIVQTPKGLKKPKVLNLVLNVFQY